MQYETIQMLSEIENSGLQCAINMVRTYCFIVL